jgi:hypothetical protein
MNECIGVKVETVYSVSSLIFYCCDKTLRWRQSINKAFNQTFVFHVVESTMVEQCHGGSNSWEFISGMQVQGREQTGNDRRPLKPQNPFQWNTPSSKATPPYSSDTFPGQWWPYFLTSPNSYQLGTLYSNVAAWKWGVEHLIQIITSRLMLKPENRD